jgi:cytochrome c6
MALKNTLLIGGLITLLVLSCAGDAGTSSTPPGGRSRGAVLFGTHCTLCHGKDGTLGISGAKDLSVSALSKDEMIALVTNGKGAMTAYKNVLTKAEIEAVVEHVLTLQSTE